MGQNDTCPHFIQLQNSSGFNKSYTDLFMRNITTGYCIKAHVELSTEMQNLKGGKGKYLFFIKRILCEDGKTTHITRTKRIIRQYDSFITCCIICGNLNVKDGSDV